MLQSGSRKREIKMNTYLLEPISSALGNADWDFSTCRSPVRIEAEDEQWARILATARFFVGQPEAEGPRRPPRSPWMQADLVGISVCCDAPEMLEAA
jgi:SH3-like domain-containing protein